jgi:energy-coupling factor transport system permease protein
MMTGVGPSLAAERGTSRLHRLNPIVKLAWLLAVVVVALATYHPLPLFAIAATALVVAASAGVAGRVARILLIFGPVTASMIVVQTLSPASCQSPSCAVPVALGPLTLYPEGLVRGLSLAGRLLAVESVALAIITTTLPSDWSAAFARLRLPYLANLMLTMTLQLVPTLQQEFDTVLAAQRARGMPSSGFRAVLPSFVPVFAGAFERIHQLTIALESRGFGASGTRTSYRRVAFGPPEAVATLAALVAGVVGSVAGLTMWSASRMPEIVLPPGVVSGVFIVAGTLFVGVIVAGVRALARA